VVRIHPYDYDVSGATVEILAIVTKSEAGQWLAQFANLA